MSQEAVNRHKESEEGETAESPGKLTQYGDSDERSFQTKTSTKKRRSKYNKLENKFNKKFDDFNSKLDRLFTLFGDNRRESSPSNTRKDDVSGDEFEPCRDDILSLHDKDDKIDSESDSDMCENISESTRKYLIDIFGEDAKVTSDKKQIGISIDSSQRDVLNNGYRTSTPSFLTAFSENLVELFPVDEDTEKFLQVPPIDELIESCLIKRYCSKAAFSNSKVKDRSLYTQPNKMVERISYKGGHASRMGIIIQLYVQQSLGQLLQTIQSETFDKEKAVKQVKDIFSMATKGLDQIGRSGAFHHIFRRACAMTDTALYQLTDSSKIQNLPLTGHGIFGSKFENLLKTRKEHEKQIEDLLPDIQIAGKKDNVTKRKSQTQGPMSSTKKPCYDKPSTSGGGNFRIPKIPKSGDRQYSKSDFQYDQKPGFRPSREQSFSRNSTRGRGKTDKQDGHDGPVSLHWLIREIHSYQTLHYLGIGLKHKTPYKD